MGNQCSKCDKLHWIWFDIVPTTTKGLLKKIPDWSGEVSVAVATTFIKEVEKVHPGLGDAVKDCYPKAANSLVLAEVLTHLIDLYGMAAPTKQLWRTRSDPCVISQADWLVQRVGMDAARALLVI